MKVKGFSAAAVQAGIKYKDRLDLGLIFSEIPAVTAGAFTTNLIKAAPVVIDQERLQQGRAQAVLVNSGNANACTGKQGMETARLTSTMAAASMNIDEQLVQIASTGVIGEELDPAPFKNALPGLVDQLSETGFDDLANAIMTTDTVPKIAKATVTIEGREVNLLGVAKGSGMIRPDMATMLCFVVTDAQIVFTSLKEAVTSGVDATFNQITVDGDTSTNDTVLVMANGMAENPWIDEDNPEAYELFANALHTIFQDLARKIVQDGEGATKLITVRVTGARNKKCAVNAAQAIANSALVKTAFFGEDANWGRIIAALGRSGCRFQPKKVCILFDQVLMVKNGVGQGVAAEKAASEILKNDAILLTVELHDGIDSAEVLTCDLSYDYVKINADYRS